MLAIPNNPKIVTVGDLDSAVAQNYVDEIMALPDEEDEEAVQQQNRQLGGLSSYVQDKFIRSRDQRREHEERWTESYRNYLGAYGPDMVFSDTEKSRVFIKITKTKVNAAHAQITDVLFSGSKFPIGVESTNNPKGIAEAVYFDPEDKSKNKDEPKSERLATAVRPELKDLLGPYRKQLERLEETDVEIEEGFGTTPTSFTFEPAYKAAKNMEKKIHDQLEEAHASKSLRGFVHELCLFGTGVFKGPFHKTKEYPKWDKDGQYVPEQIIIPDVTNVSIWDAYPDPDARNIDEAEYFIQRHKMSRTELRNLKKRPYFRAESIEDIIKSGANYQRESWENYIGDQEIMNAPDRWEVLEFWGIIDKEIAEQAELTLPESMDDVDQVQINAWVCGGNILRLVLNPFTPNRIPYYVVPYEINPYSMWGVGVADNMADTQMVMNGFMRMTIDNAALSGNVIFEVDESALEAGQDLKMSPGKVLRRAVGSQQALFSHKINNTTQENLMVFDKARQLADEATGLPSYSHGQAGIQGVGRTASGMSMLMSAADKNIKAVVRNIDDYLLAPMGKAMFSFNMQFNFDDEAIIGDLEVVARGTESLMRSEVRSQKLMQFLQMTANPIDAPFIKRDYILREVANTMDIDAEKAINDPREAGIQAVLMKELKEAQGEPTGQPSPQQAPQGGPSSGPSGGMDAGNAAVPGEQGFSANTGEMTNEMSGGTGGQEPSSPIG